MKLYQDKYPISDNVEYVIEYVCENPLLWGDSYYQLVRLCDDAILCTAEDHTDVLMYCWSVGIEKNIMGLI